MSGNGVTLRRILKSTACAIGTVLAITAFATVGFISLTNTSALAAELSGTVQGAKQPIAGSTVTLFAAGTGAPKQLAQGKSDDSGAFALTYADAPADSALYVVAKGGTPKAPAAKAQAMPSR